MEEDEGSLTVGLAEFASLKNEIQYRASAQLTLLSLDITAVGAISGISLSQHQSALVLFMAILCPALGIFYLDHDRHIRTLGAHIRDSLWPRIGRGIPSWESKNHERLYLPVVRRFFVAPVIVAFGGPALAALVFVPLNAALNPASRDSLANAGLEVALYVAGLVTSGMWLWSVIDSPLNPVRPARGAE